MEKKQFTERKLKSTVYYQKPEKQPSLTNKGSPFKSMTYDLMQKNLLAKEEQLKKKDQVIAQLQHKLQLQNQDQTKIRRLEKKVEQLERVISILERKYDTQQTREEVQGGADGERQEFQKHMKRKTSYFKFSVEGSQQDIQSVSNVNCITDQWEIVPLQKPQYSYMNGYEGLGQRRRNNRMGNVQSLIQVPMLSFTPNEHSRIQPNRKSRDEPQLFTYRARATEPIKNGSKKEEIQTKFRNIKIHFNERKNCRYENETIKNIIQQNNRKKDHQSALKNINEKLQQLLKKSSKNETGRTRYLQISVDSDEALGNKTYDAKRIDSSFCTQRRELNRSGPTKNLNFDRQYPKTPKQSNTTMFRTQRNTHDSPFMKENELASWKKNKNYDNSSLCGMKEFKKQKIISGCSDINQLLRIRKCYGNDESNMLEKSTISYRSTKQDNKDRNYLLQKPSNLYTSSNGFTSRKY